MLKKLAGLFRTNHSNDLENLQRRAEHGDAEAMYLLGRMYHIGELVEADDEKAMLLYRRANALGYPLAANSIGALYETTSASRRKLWSGLNKASAKATNRRKPIWDGFI